jgi:membrane protein DedA with SNARE-associated domain
MIENILMHLVALIDKFGYFGIAFLMTIESSFLPFPSEIVIPPAGYLASKGKMNIILVILAGSIGSVIGAYINYYIGKIYGKKFILGIGKYFGVKEKHFDKAEAFFYKHGAISTFTGRLLPVIRQYISIPAGIAKMSHIKFAGYTFLGALIWNTVLAVIGYLVGDNQEKIKEYSKELTICAIIVVAVIISIYIFINYKKNRGEADGNV